MAITEISTTDLQIVVTLDRGLLEDAIRTVWERSLMPGAGYHEGGVAYNVIAKQVRTFSATLDVTDLIRAELTRQLPIIIADVVSQTMRVMIKRHIKHMQDSGQIAALFEDMEKSVSDDKQYAVNP